MSLPGNVVEQLLSMGKNNYQAQPKDQQIDKLQLKLAMRNIDNKTLTQLVSQARQQGIPDNTIEQGLDFLLKL